MPRLHVLRAPGMSWKIGNGGLMGQTVHSQRRELRQPRGAARASSTSGCTLVPSPSSLGASLRKLRQLRAFPFPQQWQFWEYGRGRASACNFGNVAFPVVGWQGIPPMSCQKPSPPGPGVLCRNHHQFLKKNKANHKKSHQEP